MENSASIKILLVTVNEYLFSGKFLSLMKKCFLPVSTLGLLMTFFACSQREKAPAEDEIAPPKVIVQSEKQKFQVDTITNELKNPWGITFLSDGRILVTERAGEIRIIKDGKLLPEKLEGVPAVFAHGQGGLLDITRHPDYETNGWIYFSYAKAGNDGGGTTIARAKIDGNKMTDLQELFSASPFSDSGVHFGSRIVFDGNGYMFFSCGERGEMKNAQTLENHLGKILRLHDDGRVPVDNPFVKTKASKPEIWSYGHRNPQGLVFDRATNSLYDIEHGPKGGDELNKVEKGKNYGWPVITWGIDYDGKPISEIQQKEGMEQPLRYWVPSIAPCGAALITSDKFPNWRGNILVGALAHTHVARVELQDQKYVKEEKLLDKIGRVRAIAQGPDGFIYVATENPGLLVRLVPAD
jgi:aldose sugar dehydrogenase